MLVITYFIYEKQPANNSMTLILPFNVIQGRILSGKLKGHIWYTVYEMQPVDSYVTIILPLNVI